MKTFDMKEGGHKWEKQNVVTQTDRNGLFDTYKCAKCGACGKSYRMGEITVSDRTAYRIHVCNGLQRKPYVKVTRCNAAGNQFSNLTPDTIHQVIVPPKGYDNKRGEWVMGVGEPVLLLFGEFVYVDKEGGEK